MHYKANIKKSISRTLDTQKTSPTSETYHLNNLRLFCLQNPLLERQVILTFIIFHLLTIRHFIFNN